jgi:hypothetical protein
MRHPGELEANVCKCLLNSNVPLNTSTIVSDAKRCACEENSERIQVIRILKKLVLDNYAVRKVRGHADVVYHLTDEGRVHAQNTVAWYNLSKPKNYPFCSGFLFPVGHMSMGGPAQMSENEKKRLQEDAKEMLDKMPSNSYMILRKE